MSAQTLEAPRLSVLPEETGLEPGKISLTPPIEVPKPASRDQVKYFVENGFLTVEGLVHAAELEELKADMLKLARGGYACESLKPVPEGLSDAEVLKNI